MTSCITYCNYIGFNPTACLAAGGNPNITLAYLNGCQSGLIPSFDISQFRMQIASNVPLYYTVPLNGWISSSNPFNPSIGYFDGSFNSNQFTITGPGEPHPGSNINIQTDPYFGLITSYSAY